MAVVNRFFATHDAGFDYLSADISSGIISVNQRGSKISSFPGFLLLGNERTAMVLRVM